MVFGAQKGFDLWSYLMFPGEFASCGDLEESPASRTWGEAAAQKRVALTRLRLACLENAGSAASGPPPPMAYAWWDFPHSFHFCPDEIAL